MASGKLLRQLIKYGARGDVAGFRAAAEAAIEEERQKQHHLRALLGAHTRWPQELLDHRRNADGRARLLRAVRYGQSTTNRCIDPSIIR